MNELSVRNSIDPAIMEQVMVNGDLSLLKPEQRISYYKSVCDSVGLNPLTKPFSYIRLNGKLVLYALKDATDQIRKINGVSIGMPKVDYLDDLIIVTVTAIDKTGKKDSDLGVVNLAGKKGDDKANAIMKAITKAKRRVTLSICGLGWLDETEVETIPGAELVTFDEAEIIAEPEPSLVEAAQELGGVVKNSMSLETAENMKDSKGKRYGDMTNDQLSGYSIGIGKLLADNGLTAEKHDEYTMKMDAIKVILEARK